MNGNMAGNGGTIMSKVLMKGNEAISLRAAIQQGCRYFSLSHHSAE